MAFCSPICKMFFKSGQNADKSRSHLPGKVTSEDEDTIKSEEVPQPPSDTITPQNIIASKPNETRELTKEEKLKQKRREEIEKLRETLRNRKQLLAGTVEVPMRRGTIEGYNIRISRGKERHEGGKRRHTFELEDSKNRKNLQPTTRESMEKFAKFIEAKIQQIEERKNISNRGDEQRITPGVPDDPVQDALIDRLIELQPDKRKIVERKGSMTKEESKGEISKKPRRMSEPSKVDDHPKRERPTDLTIKSSEKQAKPNEEKEIRGKPDGEKIAKRTGSMTKEESKGEISKKPRRMSDHCKADDHPKRERPIDTKIESSEKQTNRKEDKEERGKPDREKIAKRKGSMTGEELKDQISKSPKQKSDPSKIDDHPKQERHKDLAIKPSEKQSEHKKYKEERGDPDKEKIAKRKGSLTKEESKDAIALTIKSSEKQRKPEEDMKKGEKPDRDKIEKRKGSLTKEESKERVSEKPRRMSDPSKKHDHPLQKRPIDLTIKSLEKRTKPKEGNEGMDKGDKKEDKKKPLESEHRNEEEKFETDRKLISEREETEEESDESEESEEEEEVSTKKHKGGKEKEEKSDDSEKLEDDSEETSKRRKLGKNRLKSTRKPSVIKRVKREINEQMRKLSTRRNGENTRQQSITRHQSRTKEGTREEE